MHWRFSFPLLIPILSALLAPLFWYYEIKGRIYEGHLLFQNAAQYLAERKTHKRAEIHFARRLNAYLAWLCFRRAEMNEAVARFQPLTEDGLDALEGNERVFVMAHFAAALFEQGRKDEALRWFESALALCAQIRAPWEQALAYNHYGAEWNSLGNLARGEEAARLLTAAEAAMQTGHTSGMDAVTGLLAGLTVWHQEAFEEFQP
ncbi:MAG: hypothetical protein Fur0043_19840 [Anaerolineales bacterium]